MFQSKPRFFYGWVIAVAGMLTMATVTGITGSCFSQYIKPICADLGFTRQAMSINQTINMVCQVAFSFLWASIANRIPVKKMMVASAVLCPAIYYSFSFVHNIYVFYLLTLCLSLCSSMLSTLPFSMIISNWFYEKKGTAMGLCFMGSGLGGMVLNPLLGRLLTDYGWRFSYRALAILMLVITLPCILLIHTDPSHKGLQPLGRKMQKAALSDIEQTGMTLAEARRTGKFWLLLICCASITACLGSINSTLSPHYTDSGYSITYAAGVLSVGMGVTAIGKFSLGRAFDKLGARNAAAGFLCFGLLGLTGMILCKHPVGVVLTAIGLAANGYGAIANPNIIQRVFGRREQSKILGYFSAFNSIGASLSPIINGAVFDRTGSYTPAYFFWLGLLTFVVLSFLVVIPAEKHN